MSLPQKTLAAVLYQLNEPVVVEELEIPQLEAGQVLVQVAFSGVCQTQLLEVRGKKGNDPYLPHTLGHEGSGKVLAVGPGVTQVQPNDTVVLSWIKGPGQNAKAPKYKNKAGQVVNAGQVATFTQYAVVAENRCTRIPNSSIPLSTLALLGCAVPTGAGIVINQLGARPGQSVAVMGTGGIGLSAILAAKMLNCDPIVAIDIHDDKLRFAKELGASHTIHAKNQDPVSSLFAITKTGVDYVVEASGQKSAMEQAYKMVRDSGGRLIIAGNLSHGEKISIDPFDLIKGKQIVGTAGGQTAPEKDLPLYARLNQEGKFPIEKLAAQFFKLDQVNLVFDLLEKGSVGRLMIEF